ncbi:N12 class adenine-specific DNA methylase/adenine-specific DNA methylase [Rhodoblastus acidophilus]|uniref:N-6 DNA methylase n=1 Tax=Rhodoblastus acidophilus TaxID=1074 RepID=UPI00222553D3|nr:N-6 DNA methylase [Rhodoblastus acidophilus]MCW2286321.1 N12 class adenine-specific DNA methylase/adenine-specific DNA methylase [Rhodoblastus acidophilus]MCW2335216.1 N12 class adenine-specific DNA methylase/adenine-specific DNA methylase [Rhodoblastus acidophilus]
MKKSIDQMTLPLFDTTALSTGAFGLYSGLSLGEPAEDDEPEAEDQGSVAKPVATPARNFRLRGSRPLASDWKSRAADNLAAIRLMQQIEGEARNATPEEQSRLARFISFGAGDLANNLFRRAADEALPKGWETLGQELEQLVSPTELASLARVTQYAHFTPEFIIRAMWKALRRIGFSEGRVLEPGCGSGLFFSMLPDALADKTTLTGVELDPVTAKITKLLFPNAQIRNEDFTKARLPDNYDLVIGNPPFSTRTVRGSDPVGALNLSLHDYFIARSIERLRPGGIAAFVTSRWTMDKTDATARTFIASMADLLCAVRLPEGAMRAGAGTDVVVDVLIFQKRDQDQAPKAANWIELDAILPAEDGEDELRINQYFVAHPAMTLGAHARTTSAYGPTYTCLPTHANEPALFRRLIEALYSVPPAIYAPRPQLPKELNDLLDLDGETIDVGTAAEGATIKEGSYLVVKNSLAQIINGRPVPVAVRQGKGTEGIPAKHARIIRGLIQVRDAVREVLRAQAADQPWGVAQVRLRSAYAHFKRDFGPINLTTISETTTADGDIRETVRRPNLQPFLDDPDVWLVASIEDYDVESGHASQGPIFSQRVLHPPTTPEITSAADALAVVLHETGTVDVDRIAELLGVTREAVIADLGDRIFLDPIAHGTNVELWHTADAYLSGDIRKRLAAATEAAMSNPRFQRNVDALKEALPEDLKPSEITARLGAPWIPAEVIAKFCEEIMGVKTLIYHTVEIACWTVTASAFQQNPASTSDWGTLRRHAGELMIDALNSRIPQIYDEYQEDGVTKRVLNAPDTEAAKDKLAKIKQAFENWIWTDAERAETLAKLYNERFNNLVPRCFDGSHLTIPGASSVIKFYSHQKRAIWRILAAGSTYVAHAVGAGKTFTLAAAVMEQKRLALITKPMMTVPGHCLAQAAREFLQLYPTARILVADETNFAKDKRQRFLARAATANWDCIIITHSAFKFIATPAKFEEGLIADQLASYAELMSRIDKEDRVSIKRLERMKEGIEAKLEALQSRKDDMLTIAEIGVDQIIVDEMQEFRKLSFTTNQSTLKGVDPDGSQRAWDLYVKTRFLALNRRTERALIAASGTPITNTLGEMYTIQRFFQPDMLEERGIQEFDAWAASFGETTTDLELQPWGIYKPVTRFAQFVNVPELISMFRDFADVVLKSDLRENLKLPRIASGQRQIITAPATPAFKAYQKVLAQRIKAIENRQGRPKKGDDILLSVITDGRHAAIDLRFTYPDHANEPESKLNALIDKVFQIWRDTSDRRYRRPDGTTDPTPGATQMIFSDLGTPSVAESRGFSAYLWIRETLIARGVPASEIAFMQDFKRSAAKQRLFNDMNGGKKRILIGSSETMGTGVNAQKRLVALHHLDVPWLPSQVEQREGRIERQGNQNEEIELYAYATKGSVDATGWQTLERKARFIEMAMSGDRSIRRIEDVGAQANQFGLAKAIASGDERLMRKAGVEAEIARLERLRDNHFDEQIMLRGKIERMRNNAERARLRITQIEADIAKRRSTRGDAFAMTIDERSFTDRKEAGSLLLKHVVKNRAATKSFSPHRIGAIGGFDLRFIKSMFGYPALVMARTGSNETIETDGDLTPLGLISRIEHVLSRFEADLRDENATIAQAETWLPSLAARLGARFQFNDELAEKRAELAEINASLATTKSEADYNEPIAAAA